MPLPTCAVQCYVYTQDGNPDPGATVRAKLTHHEVYQGHIVPEEMTAVTDVDGLAVLELWPNELGSTGSSYKVKIEPTDGNRTVTVYAVVPLALEANLFEIATLPPYDGKPDGQLGVEAANAALVAANNAVNSASASATTAGEQAGIATTQANAAASAAGAASSSAGAAATSEGVATTQAGIATGAAGTATTQAGISTTQVGIATAQAEAAAASAIAAAASASFSNQGIDLRVGMDYIYGAGLWSQHSGAPGSGSDIGPALSHVLGLLGGRGDVLIPVGSWRMATPPSAALLSGRRIRGNGSQASGIVYDANSGTAFRFSGTGGFTGGGISGLSIHLESGYPSSTAQAIRLEGDATYQPDQMVFEDVYISALGASYWNAGFFAYGNVRITPQGIRVCTVKNMQVFRCNATGIYLSNVVQFSAENIGVYVGTGGGANIYIAGGGSAPNNSVQVYIRGAVATELNITNSSKFEISGTFATFATDTTASDGRVLGFGAVLSGTLGANVTLSA